jgi:hypothetical protein
MVGSAVVLAVTFVILDIFMCPSLLPRCLVVNTRGLKNPPLTIELYFDSTTIRVTAKAAQAKAAEAQVCRICCPTSSL